MKFLARMLTILVVVSSINPALAVAQTSTTRFSDVPRESEFDNAVNYLNDKGIVVGYEDGTFKPNNKINRAEFLKIVMAASEFDAFGSNCFSDVQDQWFAPYVCRAAQLKLVDGYADGSFKPEKNINFAEASKIIANVLSLELEPTQADLWFKNYILALEDKFAIPASIKSFDYEITRAEMAEMVYRLDAGVTNRLSSTFTDLSSGIQVQDFKENLQPFRSCVALKNYLEVSNAYRGEYEYAEEGMVGSVAPTTAQPSKDASAPANESSSGSAGPDYSTTNVQVAGVDEADIVKTDGKNIFLVKGNSVRVVSAYPPENMKELDKIDFGNEGFYPTEMYVDGKRLVVIGSGYGDLYMIEPAAVSANASSLIAEPGYYGYSRSLTRAFVFDITNPADIKQLRELSFEGGYLSSRKIDDQVYLVSNEYSYYPALLKAEPEALLPNYYDSESGKVAPVAGCADVSFVPGSEARGYTLVSTFSLNDNSSTVNQEIIFGGGGQVYASTENLYLAEPKYSYWYYGRGGNSEESTIVHKFKLNNGDVRYAGKGKVPGHILNQFSMDEYAGNFRIATTKGQVWDSTVKSTNNVYVLDSELNNVGAIEGIAPGESIYSVRFMGKRAYMVTFKKVDPLFVIDLADAKNPKILGQLKIPGYSDYLHPFGENYLIGFGKDAVDASQDLVEGRNLDFAWYQGMKVAMFDVSDVKNPKELHSMIIGDRGTDSPLLYDHKALLFDESRKFMAFPITVAEISKEAKADPNFSASTYGDPVFQGAHVYDFNVDGGFKLRGKISHYTPTEVADKAGYYWYGEKDINRILYIGKFFYTVSQGAVKASNMTEVTDVKMVDLAKGEDDYNYYPVY